MQSRSSLFCPVQQCSHWRKMLTSPFPPQQRRVKEAIWRREASHRNQRSDDGEGHKWEKDGEKTVQSMMEQSLDGRENSRKEQRLREFGKD